MIASLLTKGCPLTITKNVKYKIENATAWENGKMIDVHTSDRRVEESGRGQQPKRNPKHQGWHAPSY